LVFSEKGGAVVSAEFAYLHTLAGRLRVKVTAVKGSPQKAEGLERQFRVYGGITQVTANPVTGNVLILYDAQQVSQKEILDILKERGYFSGSGAAVPRNTAVGQQGSRQELVQTLLRSALEFALEKFRQELLQALVRSTLESALQRLVYALI
jgi:copper chaperone CopZ